MRHLRAKTEEIRKKYTEIVTLFLRIVLTVSCLGAVLVSSFTLRKSSYNQNNVLIRHLKRKGVMQAKNEPIAKM